MYRYVAPCLQPEERMTDVLRSSREPKQPEPDRSTKDVENPSRRRRYPVALHTSPFPRHPVLPSGHGRKQESNLLMPAVSSYCFVSDFTESFGAKEECERRIRITGCPAVPRQNSPLFDTLTVKRPLGRTPSKLVLPSCLSPQASRCRLRGSGFTGALCSASVIRDLLICGTYPVA
ncbi:hypothetical protein QQF64_018685 [Cirrhinus molitorella]|uniref:Uncharacterized protein n=1 Tax=Cirrhinus molitorella TaxID=172907 RepID=A0ABR3LGT4_9TELE